ncbi:MAG: hypothetical protein CSA36_00275 [Draconibacterium sp.]|nr:MAG: hypothetical protein CSA36_00275 [Draconibacterium sp.]
MRKKEQNIDINKLLDEVLTTDPGFVLPDYFADKLVEKAQKHYNWSQYLNEFFLYLAALAGIAGVLLAIAFILFNLQWQTAISVLSSHAISITGFAVLTIFIVFADRVLLRYFLQRPPNNFL